MYSYALTAFAIVSLLWLISFWANIIPYFDPKFSPAMFLFNFAVLLFTLLVFSSKRSELNRVPFTSSQTALFGFFVIIVIWIMAGVSHLTDVQSTTTILMLPAILLVTMGPYVARVLFFPILFFLLIIPFYESSPHIRIILFALAVVLALVYLNYDLLLQKIFKKPKTISPGMLFDQPGKDLIEHQARFILPTVICCSLIIAAPWLSDNIRSFFPFEKKEVRLIAPPGLNGWSGPTVGKDLNWTPEFVNPSAVINVVYRNNLNQNVYLYSAYYQSDRNVQDLLNPENKLYKADNWENPETQGVVVPLKDNFNLAVQETVLHQGDLIKIIWSWYYILGISTNDKNYMELLDKIRIISKYADGSGVIAISTGLTNDPTQARAALASFLQSLYPFIDLLERPEKF